MNIDNDISSQCDRWELEIYLAFGVEFSNAFMDTILDTGHLSNTRTYLEFGVFNYFLQDTSYAEFIGHILKVLKSTFYAVSLSTPASMLHG